MHSTAGVGATAPSGSADMDNVWSALVSDEIDASAEPSAPMPRLSVEHDFLFGYATSPGNVAYRGALFRACARRLARLTCTSAAYVLMLDACSCSCTCRQSVRWWASKAWQHHGWSCFTCAMQG